MDTLDKLLKKSKDLGKKAWNETKKLSTKAKETIIGVGKKSGATTKQTTSASVAGSSKQTTGAASTARQATGQGATSTARQKTSTTKDKAKTKEKVHLSKKNLIKTLISLAILILVIVLIVVGVSSLIKYIVGSRNGADVDDGKKFIYSNMYNASRFFFRVNYPDDWNVESERYGHMLDSETGLVIELYPLIDPVVSEGETVVDKIRDTRTTVSIYYKEYADGEPKDLISVASKVNSEYSAKYTVGEAKTRITSDIEYKYWSYSYTDTDEVTHNAEAYVAVRNNNYIVITYDSIENIPSYYTVFANMLDDFRLTVSAVDKE